MQLKFGAFVFLTLVLTVASSATPARSQGLVDYALILVYNGATTGRITTQSVPYAGFEPNDCNAETAYEIYDPNGNLVMRTKSKGTTASSELPADFEGDYYIVSVRQRFPAACRPTTSFDGEGALPLSHSEALVRDRFHGSGRLFVGPINFTPSEDLTLARVVEVDNQDCLQAIKNADSAIIVRDQDNNVVDRITTSEGRIIETGTGTVIVNHFDRDDAELRSSLGPSGGLTFQFPPFCGYSTLSVGTRGALLVAGY